MREEAIGTIATMVGSLLLARAAAADAELSADILKAGRKKALAGEMPDARRASLQFPQGKVAR
jgi:TetR/AcrR family transcriptional repressor of nem operon